MNIWEWDAADVWLGTQRSGSWYSYLGQIQNLFKCHMSYRAPTLHLYPHGPEIGIMYYPWHLFNYQHNLQWLFSHCNNGEINCQKLLENYKLTGESSSFLSKTKRKILNSWCLWNIDSPFTRPGWIWSHLCDFSGRIEEPGNWRQWRPRRLVPAVLVLVPHNRREQEFYLFLIFLQLQRGSKPGSDFLKPCSKISESNTMYLCQCFEY